MLAKNLLLMDTDIKRPGEEEKFTTYDIGYRHQRGYKSCGRLSWMVQTHLNDGMRC